MRKMAWLMPRMARAVPYAVGALLAGVVADLFGLSAAIWVVAVVTALPGAVVAVRMYETRRPGAGTSAAVPPPAAHVPAAPPAGVR